MRGATLLGALLLVAGCSRGASSAVGSVGATFTATATTRSAQVFTGDTTLIAITITNQGPGSLYVAPGTCNSDFRLVGATSGAVYYPGEPELCTQSAVAPFNLAVGGNYSYTVWTTGRVRSGSATAAVATIAPGTYTVQTYLMSTVGGDAIARQSTSTGTTITFR